MTELLSYLSIVQLIETVRSKQGEAGCFCELLVTIHGRAGLLESLRQQGLVDKITFQLAIQPLAIILASLPDLQNPHILNEAYQKLNHPI